MEPRLHVITLAVDELERALAFYRDGLGFDSPGIIGTEWTDNETGASGAVALFELDGGLAKDAQIPVRPTQSGEFSLGQLVQSRAEVDALLQKAEAAGATVTAAHDRPWGIYSGYFRDPDGHLWEIIWNPNRVPTPMTNPDRKSATT